VVAVASDIPIVLPSTVANLALDDLETIADVALMRAIPVAQMFF
jgi:hypothetical protein